MALRAAALGASPPAFTPTVRVTPLRAGAAVRGTDLRATDLRAGGDTTMVCTGAAFTAAGSAGFGVATVFAGFGGATVFKRGLGLGHGGGLGRGGRNE